MENIHEGIYRVFSDKPRKTEFYNYESDKGYKREVSIIPGELFSRDKWLLCLTITHKGKGASDKTVKEELCEQIKNGLFKGYTVYRIDKIVQDSYFEPPYFIYNYNPFGDEE